MSNDWEIADHSIRQETDIVSVIGSILIPPLGVARLLSCGLDFSETVHQVKLVNMSTGQIAEGSGSSKTQAISNACKSK